MSEQQSDSFDLIVIGAGINGAGVARDAAMRGLTVCVIDKGDIASGTSSWSTRLIHGGLRYLEHLELGLVRESLRERETLLRIAPHLVKPLPILIPIYQGARRGKLQIRTGMLLYDLLSKDKTLPRYRILSRDEALKQAPGLNTDGLNAAAVYYDAQVEFAERLVLENILAAQKTGTKVFTYSRVVRLSTANGKATGVELICNDQRKILRGDFIINAAGPWVDELLQTTTNTNRLIGGTKGSHIVVAPFRDGPSNALYTEAQTDGRPFFIIPWNGNYLIGTTDVHFEGDLDQVSCDESEIEYLLAETNRVLPRSKLTRNEILFTYSGVRPLPFTDVRDEQKITRRHFIRQHREFANVCSLVGGKLTTYRSLAEETVDLVFDKLSRKSPKCSTADVLLPGAEDFATFAAELGAQDKFTPTVRNRLLQIYGSRTEDLLELCKRNSELGQPLNNASQVLTGEIVFAFEREMAQTLSDCLLRRTMLGLNSDLAIGADEEAAQIGQRFLGWTDDRAKQEVENYRRYIQRLQCQTRETS
jgi:glycerol-3-phosphate dehydrogenase